MTFLDRFAAARTAANPLGLQMLFFAPPALVADDILKFLRNEPELAGATGELIRVAEVPGASAFIGGDGPPATVLGLFSWGNHAVKLAQFDAPMPYGPVETCVGPALLPPPMKVDAKQHQAHLLLFYAGTHEDVREQFAALCVVAGALARYDGSICILNEDARTACPAFDLIPDAGENALATYRQLPIPYLLGGFTKMTVGDAGVLWARTFANHRLGLPELAIRMADHRQTARIFQLFTGVAGYLLETGEVLTAGESLDLGDGMTYALREPTGAEDFLTSTGPLLILEGESDNSAPTA